MDILVKLDDVVPYAGEVVVEQIQVLENSHDCGVCVGVSFLNDCLEEEGS